MTIDAPSMGVHFKARPTVYNGVQMRSRLEAGYAAWLDHHNFGWAYEPGAFSAPGGRQYLPDFRLDEVPVLGWGTKTVYVEVKPISSVAEYAGAVALCDRMSVIRASDPDCLLLLEVNDPDRQTGTYVVVPDGSGGLRPERYLWVPYSPVDLGLVPHRWIGLTGDCQPWPSEWWKGQDVR